MNELQMDIINPKIFDFNYIPKQPLIRKEAEEIKRGIVGYCEYGIPTNFLIIGSRGIGKTLTITYIINNIKNEINENKEKLKAYYIPCRYFNKSAKIMGHILNINSRGLSFNELFEKFKEQNKERVVLIFDEIDYLEDPTLLYQLGDDTTKYNIVLISNSYKYWDSLDLSIRSRLNPQRIFFSNYSTEDIINILRNRANEGLRSYEDDKLIEISKLTFKLANSDIRIALKTLYDYLVNNKDITHSFDDAKTTLHKDIISSLNIHNTVILKCILDCQEEKNIKELYSLYIDRCNEIIEKPLKERSFYTSINHLQSLDLISLITLKTNNSPNKFIVELIVDKELIEKELEVRGLK